MGKSKLSSDKLDQLHIILINRGKKLEILLRQLRRFERLEEENVSSLKSGLVSEKDYSKSMKRVQKEKAKVDRRIKDLLESLIKEILKLT